MDGNQPRCNEPGCDSLAIGLWLWKAIDMDIAVGYCDQHAESVKRRMELAGRMAGGTPISDMRN